MSSTLEKPIREPSLLIKNGSVNLEGVNLEGTLAIPEMAQGMIVLVHGSGSHRHSHVNGYIAQELRRAAFATFLINLLTPDEEDIDMRTQHYRFDIGLLALRLFKVTEWLSQNPDTCHLKVGYFGANTESAATLVAAADHPDMIHAIVSRSGRTDLSGSVLSRIKTPTLLIVGEGDFPYVGINQDALKQLNAAKQLEMIPAATHLFEEQGALEQAIELACQWFGRHLAPDKS
jgi:dienelactone hydrolase